MIEIDLQKKLFGSSGNFQLQVSVTFEKGKLVSLYGPSGSGKTSLLRMLAGVLPAASGRISINGSIWFDSEKKINLPPQERNVGIVFQDYALFPNMTVRENIAYALQGKQSGTMVDEVIQLMELDQLYNKRPHLLSGGQRQRTALARALVRRPALLLLDEPFAALDTEIRLRIQDYLQIVHQQYNLTTVLVSHDMLDVIKLASRVFVLENGRITRTGTPAEIMPLDSLRKILLDNLKPSPTGNQ
jgi:molybdate transport system ATP-binding protein